MSQQKLRVLRQETNEKRFHQMTQSRTVAAFKRGPNMRVEQIQQLLLSRGDFEEATDDTQRLPEVGFLNEQRRAININLLQLFGVYQKKIRYQLRKERTAFTGRHQLRSHVLHKTQNHEANHAL